MPVHRNNEEASSRLALFLSRDVVERRYKALHGGELNAAKAAEIISHLQQGQQYFRSAEAAGVLAGPLEQYYGVLAFARAIVLYRVPGAREANLKKGHGLKARMPEGDGLLHRIELSIEDGTFHELLDATRNAEMAGADEHGPNIGFIPNRWSAVRSLRRPAAETKFLFEDLISRMPSARQQFEEAFEKGAHCYAGRVGLMMGLLTLTVWRGRCQLPSVEQLHTALGLGSGWHGRMTPNDSVQFECRLLDGENALSALPNVVIDDQSNHAIIEEFPGGWALSETCAFFAASHTLSMLVRYHPTIWARLLSHGRGDSILPVLDKIRRSIQDDFIRLVLWELEREAPTL